MVFDKIREIIAPQNDEKYEVLYYKYSKLKLERDKLKEQHQTDLKEYRSDISKKVANHLISLYETIETAKTSSFKVNASTKELQRLLIDVNKIEKQIKDVMKDFALEEVTASERMYDPELHEVASYEDAKGMAKGIVMKTVKKGFKHRGELIKKPHVVVTK